jgi:hypothetical protein
MNRPRFAIYFTPAPVSRLARFGNAVLGYDCDRAVDVPLLVLPGLDPQVQACAAIEPARYGFHATLVAPFHLHADTSETALAAHVASFAAGRAPLPLGRLSAGLISAFVALVRVGSQDDLMALATDCVGAFSEHRAPLSAADRERRLAAKLTPRQIELLDRWGYPYVLDEFRCHLTLTDRVSPARQPGVERTLSDWFAGSLGSAVPVDALALFTEAEPGAPFTLRAVHPLRGEGSTDSRSTGSRPTDREGTR